MWQELRSDRGNVMNRTRVRGRALTGRKLARCHGDTWMFIAFCLLFVTRLVSIYIAITTNFDGTCAVASNPKEHRGHTHIHYFVWACRFRQIILHLGLQPHVSSAVPSLITFRRPWTCTCTRSLVAQLFMKAFFLECVFASEAWHWYFRLSGIACMFTNSRSTTNEERNDTWKRVCCRGSYGVWVVRIAAEMPTLLRQVRVDYRENCLRIKKSNMNPEADVHVPG